MALNKSSATFVECDDKRTMALIGAALGLVTPSAIRARGAAIGAENNEEATPVAAGSMYVTGFQHGVKHMAGTIAPQFFGTLSTVRDIQDRLFAMRDEYASSPVVQDSIQPLIDIMIKHMKTDVSMLLKIMQDQAARIGVSKMVLSGETAMDAMLAEEFAMIGERAAKDTAHGANLVETLGIDSVTLGRQCATELMHAYLAAVTLGNDYVQGKNMDVFRSYATEITTTV